MRVTPLAMVALGGVRPPTVVEWLDGRIRAVPGDHAVDNRRRGSSNRGANPMLRSLLFVVLVVLVLIATWLAWPVHEPGAPAGSSFADARGPASVDRSELAIDSARPDRVREATSSSAVDSAPPGAQARLIVRCVARADRRPLAKLDVIVRYRDAGADAAVPALRVGGPHVADVDGNVTVDVEPSRPLSVLAYDLQGFAKEELVEVAALAPGELRELTLVLDAGARTHLCGLVVARESGGPIADGAIALGGKPITRTDRSGRFELDFDPLDAVWLQADGPGFAPAIASAVAGHEAPERALRIELLREATLEIALVLQAGETQVRAELTGRAHELSQEGYFTAAARGPQLLTYAAAADASGVCRFASLPPGVQLEAKIRGSVGILAQRAEPLVLQPGEHRRIEWDLAGCELVGRVFEPDGAPAVGVALWLLRDESGFLRYETSSSSSDVVDRATSGSDGSFRIPRVAPGTWVLAPAPTKEIAGAPQVVEVPAGVPRLSIDVRLARGLFVRGRVVAPDGTTGVQGYVATVSGAHFGVNTDAQGAFELGPLAAGKVRIDGSAYGTFLDSEPIEVEPPADGILLRLRPGAEVSGRVVDELGNGVRAAITVAGSNGGMTLTRTQPDGAFRLDGFAPGSYVLFASTADGRAGLLAGVLLDPSAPVADQRVVLAPGATVRVRHDARGFGRVRFLRDGAMIGGDGLEGGSNLTQVVPAGRVTVELEFPDGKERARQELDLAAGETREVVFAVPQPK